METLHKCAYKHCFHENKEIMSDELVIKGKNSYHADCYEVSVKIKKIASLFGEYVGGKVVYSQLYGVINNIIFEKDYTVDYLLYGVRYYINNKKALNYPSGLYYVVTDSSVKNAWEKYKHSCQKKVEILTQEENKFTYTPPKTKGFGDIIK